MPGKTTPISTEDYWEARARLAEATLAFARESELGHSRVMLATMTQVIGTMDALVATSQQSASFASRALREESSLTVARLVKEYGLEGSADSYELDLSGGPGGAVLRQKGDGSGN